MTEERGWHPGHNPWTVALTVTIATFMEVLDTSIANVALQHIAGALSVGQDESTWVLTSYLVSNAVVLPLSGWLATRFGRKRFYMTCVALFTVSSLMCGFAPSLGALIFFRVLQGAGGGGLGPSEQSILADTFPTSKRGMAFAVYGMAVVLAPAIGPTLGGYITDNYSWRWVFFINVPVGLVSLFLSNRMITDPPYIARERSKLKGFDFPGFALISLGLGCLEVVLDKGQQEDWFASSFITWFAAVAAVSLVVFVVWERAHASPIVDVRLLWHRNFGTACLMMFVLGATLFGTTVLLPQFSQMQLGYTAELAGEALSPGGLLIMALMPIVGRLLGKIDPRKLITFGFVALSGSLFYMAHHLYAGIDFRTVVELRLMQAFGLAFLFVPINTVAYVGLPREKFNAASGLINVARNMGGDVGIAAITTLVARRTQLHQTELAAHTSPFDRSFMDRRDAITQALVHAGTTTVEGGKKAIGMLAAAVAREAQVLAFIDVIWLFAVIVALVTPIAFVMRRPAPGAQAMAH